MDLIIFDCDGVLVDSEIIANRVVGEMLARYVPDLDVTSFVSACAGRTDEEVVAEVETERGIVLPPGFMGLVERAVDEALIAELRPIPGAAEAVAAVALPKAVASNSPLDRVERSLDRAGVRSFFGDRLYCAEMVARPKPAPDVYLLAARNLQVEPHRCLVIEDSISGATAAVAAGMTVIGFLGASHIVPGHGAAMLAAGAVDLVEAMPDLPGRIARIMDLPFRATRLAT